MKTAPVDGSTLYTKFETGHSKILSHNSATTLYTAAVGDTTYGRTYSAEIGYTVEVKGTNGYQVERGRVNVAHVVYLGASTDGTTASGTQAVSSGTLTITAACTYSAGTWTITMTANSSLTSPTYMCYFDIRQGSLSNVTPNATP
jgi:hypothetical protein